tara:strand:- start:1103 stop:1285 length:183 start_codon:yes stop_codon:yes gene_type:complete
MKTNRITAYDILEEMRMYGISDKKILDYIIGNNLQSNKALQLMIDTREEFLPELDESLDD